MPMDENGQEFEGMVAGAFSAVENHLGIEMYQANVDMVRANIEHAHAHQTYLAAKALIWSNLSILLFIYGVIGAVAAVALVIHLIERLF